MKYKTHYMIDSPKGLRRIWRDEFDRFYYFLDRVKMPVSKKLAKKMLILPDQNVARVTPGDIPIYCKECKELLYKMGRLLTPTEFKTRLTHCPYCKRKLSDRFNLIGVKELEEPKK